MRLGIQGNRYCGVASRSRVDEYGHIIETDADRPLLLKWRESSKLKIKENFGLSPNSLADYGRTLVGFSNR